MKTLTFISAWVCAMLLSANASAQSVTYNFVVADEGTIQLPTWGAEVTSGGVALNLLAAGSETFDNRFAVGPTNRNNESGNCFKFRTSGDWKGLWSQYADRNISILNLKKGDKVTFVISKDAQTLKQVGGSAVVSGQTITATEDGNLDFVSTGSIYIESVTIEEGDGTVPEEPEVEGEKTYDFVIAPAGSILLPDWGAEVTSGGVALNMLALGSNTFGNRFAVGPISRNNESGNCFKFRTSGDWRGLWSQYADRNISILNLKQGDKVVFVISKEDQTLKFVDGDAVISGQEYTVEADGNLDFITTGSVYIESITISPAASPTTAIQSLHGDAITNNVIYNLQGIRVDKLTRGLYIQNGKKILVK
ncbi:MAG: hypothetical protein IJ551_10425 [Prevotella sp.]|nr:hypothetical protein [Prevotella sp.]